MRWTAVPRCGMDPPGFGTADLTRSDLRAATSTGGRSIVGGRRRLLRAGLAGFGELLRLALASGAGAALGGELVEAGHPTGRDLVADGAAGLVAMLAVAEAAALGELGDVVEGEVVVG